MTADEPMSTPDSGGLREAVEGWLNRWADADDEWSPGEMRADMRRVLAAHPVPTPDSADDATVGERGCCECCDGLGADSGCQGPCSDCMGTGHSHAFDSTCRAATPDADTVSERESTASRWCTRHDEEAAECWSAHVVPATPPADDANRAPVSGGLDEGEREANQRADTAFLVGANYGRDTARREAGERIAVAKAEALREMAEAIDSGDVDHEELRQAGVGPIATRGWSEKSVIDAYDSGSVWRDWLRARADALTSDDGSGA